MNTTTTFTDCTATFSNWAMEGMSVPEGAALRLERHPAASAATGPRSRWRDGLIVDDHNDHVVGVNASDAATTRRATGDGVLVTFGAFSRSFLGSVHPLPAPAAHSAPVAAVESIAH